MIYKILVTAVLSFMGGIGFIIALLKWIISNFDKIEKLGAWGYRIFSWLHIKLEYGNVASNIQASVNTYGQCLNKEVPEVLPHAMKIEWARNANKVESFLRNGEIVVAMDYSPNRDRNLVISTLIYLKKGLLPRARSYIDKNLMKAIDFTVAKSIFIYDKHSSAVSYFFENYLQPEIKEKPQLREDCTLLDKLQKAGFFSRILLRQLYFIGQRAFPSTPDEETYKESRDFAIFVEKIATRKSGEMSTLSFSKSRIKANVMLVAKYWTKIWGTEPYERRIKTNIDKGIENMYICARDTENVVLAKQIAEEQEKAGRMIIIKSYTFNQIYQGKEHKAICIVCSLNLLKPSSIPLEPDSELNRILEDNIEEIRNGEIEIIALARLQGKKSKIAIRSESNDIDVLKCCKDQTRRKAIESALGGEKIEFIRWNNDPKSMIIASLAPLDPNSVVKVNIDVEKKQAIVEVNRWKEKSKALGKDHHNINLANKLIGWEITIKEADKEESKDARD